jgi:hypothetical protein
LTTINVILKGGANAWTPFGPKNFNDYLLDGMRGATSDLAAQVALSAESLVFHLASIPVMIKQKITQVQ